MRTVIWFLCAALRWDAVLAAMWNEMICYRQSANEWKWRLKYNIIILYPVVSVCLCGCVCVIKRVAFNCTIWACSECKRQRRQQNKNQARFENDIKFVTYKMCCRSKWFAFREFYLRLSWLICCYSICCLTFFFFFSTWNAIKRPNNDLLKSCKLSVQYK